jgi:predicted translin family RNA/ssDNA-binding protein
MGGEDLLRELIRESVMSLYDGTQTEYGSADYVDELDRIVKELQHLKTSLRSGPDRYKNRKEVHRIQSAVEAIRYLKNRARRTGVRNGLITGDD